MRYAYAILLAGCALMIASGLLPWGAYCFSAGGLCIGMGFGIAVPVIQAMILLTSAIYVLVNLLIDLSYTLFDPRIRY